MRTTVLLLAAAGAAFGSPKIDNVLIRMVPPGTTALVGGNVKAMVSSPLYGHLVGPQVNAMFDRFTADTGFDPRRDVRELLFATAPEGGVLLARGNFNVEQKPFQQAALVRHGVYNIWTMGDNGLCILDNTLAAAGNTKAIEAALDEWGRKGAGNAAKPLVDRVSAVDPESQVWGFSKGISSLLSAAKMPGVMGSVDLGMLFKGLTDTWFQSSIASGLKFEAHGTAATVKDATALRDAAKGAVGFGRLSVPEDKPELLPVLDSIAVDLQDRALAIRIDLSQKHVDTLVNALAGARRR